MCLLFGHRSIKISWPSFMSLHECKCIFLAHVVSENKAVTVQLSKVRLCVSFKVGLLICTNVSLRDN